MCRYAADDTIRDALKMHWPEANVSCASGAPMCATGETLAETRNTAEVHASAAGTSAGSVLAQPLSQPTHALDTSNGSNSSNQDESMQIFSALNADQARAQEACMSTPVPQPASHAVHAALQVPGASPPPPPAFKVPSVATGASPLAVPSAGPLDQHAPQ